MCTRQRRNNHRTRLAAVAMVAMLFNAMSLDLMATSLDVDDLPTAVVRVDNVADVSAENVRVAEKRAADVFGQVGARLTWVDADSAIREQLRPRFTIVLARSDEHSKRSVLSEEVLGFASPLGHRAYVFYDRLEALSERSQRSTASLLGDAIAHELGHLMLPTPGHSADGIMRRGVEIRLHAIQTFTRTQAREIVARLRQTPDGSGQAPLALSTPAPTVISITRAR